MFDGNNDKSILGKFVSVVEGSIDKWKLGVEVGKVVRVFVGTGKSWKLGDKDVNREGREDRNSEGTLESFSLGMKDGKFDGVEVLVKVGLGDGFSLGTILGTADGWRLGENLGLLVGELVGIFVRLSVKVALSSVGKVDWIGRLLGDFELSLKDGWELNLSSVEEGGCDRVGYLVLAVDGVNVSEPEYSTASDKHSRLLRVQITTITTKNRSIFVNCVIYKRTFELKKSKPYEINDVLLKCKISFVISFFQNSSTLVLSQ